MCQTSMSSPISPVAMSAATSSAIAQCTARTGQSQTGTSIRASVSFVIGSMVAQHREMAMRARIPRPAARKGARRLAWPVR